MTTDTTDSPMLTRQVVYLGRCVLSDGKLGDKFTLTDMTCMSGALACVASQRLGATVSTLASIMSACGSFLASRE